MKTNNKVINEQVSTEEFEQMIIESCVNEEESKKEKVLKFAKKIAKKYEEYKIKAMEVLENAEEMDKFMERVAEKLTKLGPVGRKFAYIPEMIMLIRSYVIKEYTDISFGEIVAIIAALIYFVSPYDVFSDIIPIFGFLDDLLVMKAVLTWCDDDIEKYMKWRE